MTREEKLEAIYKEMANKELNLGCKVRFDKWIYTIIDRENVWFLDSYKGVDWNIHNTIVVEDGVNSRCYSIEEIIWHPVMIGDVLDWIERKMGISNHEYEEFVINEVNMAVLLWGEYPKPIEEQSDECIDYVYSLIQK